MAGGGDTGGLSQGLTALQFWLLDFPQMADENSSDFDNLDSLSKLITVAEEICGCDGSSSSSSSAQQQQPASVLEAWACIHNLLNDCGASSEQFEEEDFESRECQYIVLSALLCHALSSNCQNQKEYVGRIMGWDRPDMQQEIMAIVQENAHQGSSDTESVGETGDYSVLMNASLASASLDLSQYGINTSCQKRGREEAFGNDDDDGGSDDNYTPQEIKRHNHSADDDNADGKVVSKQLFGSDDDDQMTITKLKQELKDSRQQEMDLTGKVDEMQSQHRAEMLQIESKYLQQLRDMEEKYSTETNQQKKELERLREIDGNITELKDENLRLRDELDILQDSKEKFTHTEEQLRKCREKIEAFGDIHDALQREEKAHAASVDKCLELESELAQYKPLKRQVEEYRVRATDAEVALTECRDDLRRYKEKSSGLEGANIALQRGADLQQAEATALQKRLQEEGQQPVEGMAVGVGMSELNPELMEELKMLRCEYARLKEFESKREVDSVQRLEESYDDAKRLSTRFKEQFLRTKSELEDTQQLLSESIAREEKLQEEVKDWSQKYNELDEEMKEEMLRAKNAAVDAEREYQNEKNSLIEKSCRELKELEEKMTATLETERIQHKTVLDQVEARRIEDETRLSNELTELREQSTATLRTVREEAQQRIDELEQSKQQEVERIEKEKDDQIEALTNKGKSMIRESRAKAKALQKKISEEFEVEIESLKQEREKMISIQGEYEKAASAKIAKRDQQIKLFDTKLQESARAAEELEERAKKAERSKRELMTDNDRLRRQLGSRFGPGSESEKQLEELMSVCNSLREENRRLKENNPEGLLSLSIMPETLGDDVDSSQSHHTAGISKSTLKQFRQEFEEKIKELETEKCNLIMRNSAANAETRKAEQRSWELEEEITKVRGELTTAKLALQRTQRRDELSTSSRKSSLSATRNKENSANSTPIFHNRELPLSHSKNGGEITPKPDQNNSSAKKNDLPSLMELTSKSGNNDADQAPECKQS